MIKSLFQIGIFSVMLLFTIASCKKMKAGKTTAVKETEEEKPGVVVPPKKKNMLPVKFTTANMTVDLIYIENTALITEIKFTDGVSYEMTYTEKVLKKIQKYKDKVHVQSVDYLIVNGQITRASRFDVNGQRSTPTEKYYMTYNATSQINNIKTYAVTGALLSENTLEYHVNGNQISSTVNSDGSISNYNYGYDTKNGIFQSALFCQLLRIEIDKIFLNQGTNNVISLSSAKTPKENVVFEYLYGTDDYPTEVKVKQDGVTQTYKVTYKELK